jgi:uncharacterized membrane protein YcfT
MTAVQPRLPWVDFTKGICILLVVHFHVVFRDYVAIDWHSQDVKNAWYDAAMALLPLRMPTFFLISGFLGANALNRSLAEGERGRVHSNIYLYCIWAPLFAVFFLWKGFGHWSAGLTLSASLTQVLFASNPAWYVIALAIYFLIAFATRRFAWWVPAVLALLLSVAADSVTSAAPWGVIVLCRNLVFFIIGIRLPFVVMAIAEGATIFRFLTILSVYVFAIFVATQGQLLGVRPLISFLAIPTALMGAVLATRCRRVAKAGVWLGARTLPIYLLHFLIVPVIGHIARVYLGGLWTQSTLAALLYPLVVTASSVVLSLALYRGLRSIGCDWMFELPRRSLSGNTALARG